MSCLATEYEAEGSHADHSQHDSQQACAAEPSSSPSSPLDASSLPVSPGRTDKTPLGWLWWAALNVQLFQSNPTGTGKEQRQKKPK